jgi:hypothetical protein
VATSLAGTDFRSWHDAEEQVIVEKVCSLG